MYFSAPWCGPCRMLGPTMDQVSEQVPVQKINVDDDSELSAKYGIRNIPTVIKVDDNGDVLDKFVGVKPLDDILNFYNG